MCRSIGGSLGSPPSLAGPVSMPRHRFLDRPSAGTMTAPASSFRAESPLQSSFAVHSRAQSFRIHAPARVSSLSRPHQARPLPTGIPISRYVPSSGTLSLSTYYSARWLRGLVPSRSRLGASRSGASFVMQPPSLIGRSCPLAVGSPPAHRPSRGLNRCPPAMGSASGPYSTSRCVPLGRR